MHFKIRLIVALAAALPAFSQGTLSRADLHQQFANPPIDCWPRTRWWWMGNAMTLEDIEWQLRQMKDHGIGGVEQITMEPVYEKGNYEFLSHQYLEQIRHAVSVAETLHMSVSFNFGGPGWVFGGNWVPQDERNQCLIASALDVDGASTFSGPLSLDATINPRDVPRSVTRISPEDTLLRVIAGRIDNGLLKEDSLIDITGHAAGREISWTVPEGHWRIMAFWLAPMGDNTVDHLNKDAMQRYFDYVGEFFEKAVGHAFGSTVDSFFADSFEVPIHRNAIYWNAQLLPLFKQRMGYELTPYLPAIWWEVDAISPKIRYDVNAFLHTMGMEAFYGPFLDWCRQHQVEGRVQPYGFATDNIEGAGVAGIPEMEITAGEKDSVPWFDTRVGPRTYVASGAHLYGRNVVSTEAYTYLHWERYRETLEELKIAGDVFLASGANLFYNHGYLGTPERSFAPTRDFSAAIHIDHTNIWWRYYPHVSQYIARSCYLLRQGQYRADIAVYSPLANQWTQDCLNARRWTRDFNWGELGRLLWANGYNFDIVNDDCLQNRTAFNGQSMAIGENQYHILILPNIAAMPLESLKRIQQYVSQGGVVIAIERTPVQSTGFIDHAAKDEQAKAIATSLFAPVSRDRHVIEHTYGTGKTYRIDHVIDRTDPLYQHESAHDPFLNTVRANCQPDFSIDFASNDLRENAGLIFNHRASTRRSIYFVANVQDRPVYHKVLFRTAAESPYEWNAGTGSMRPLLVFDPKQNGIELPIRLGPFESRFYVFESEPARGHAVETTMDDIAEVKGTTVTGWTSTNGLHHLSLPGESTPRTADVTGLPAPLAIEGKWSVTFDSPHETPITRSTTTLRSWTDDPETRHFSGTAKYNVTFKLPPEYVNEDTRLELDLGRVGMVADVSINENHAGVKWYRSQTFDVTGLVRTGENTLTVHVTNTLINHVAGLDRMPPVPDDLVPRLGQGLHEDAPHALSLIGYEPLPPSGLLGPVTIQPKRRVRFPTK